MVAIGGGSQSHNLHDEEARMRKLVRDRKSASRRKSKNGRRLQTSLETFDEVDPCDVDEEEDEDEASQKVFGRSASWVSKGGLTCPFSWWGKDGTRRS